MTGMYGESRTIGDTQSVMYASDASRVSADAIPMKAFLCAAAMYCEQSQTTRQYLRARHACYNPSRARFRDPQNHPGSARRCRLQLQRDLVRDRSATWSERVGCTSVCYHIVKPPALWVESGHGRRTCGWNVA